jgi:prepilin-type N-terminal cleavage/methylation domain-containing protein
MKQQTTVRRPNGFTLLEMLVVFAILGILTLIAIPEMLQRIRESKIRGIAQQISTMLRSARLEGVKAAHPGIVETLPWDDDRPWETVRSFADVNRNGTYDAGADRLLGTFDLPEGIEFVDPAGLDPGPAVFQTTGAVQNVVTVGIRDGAGNELEIRVEPIATARVTIWKMNPGPVHVLDTMPEEWL